MGRQKSSSGEIRRIVTLGKKIQTDLFRIYTLPGERKENRVAVIVGKRLGKAYQRNKAKRRLKEIVRLEEGLSSCGADIVVIPEKASIYIEFQVLKTKFHQAVASI